MVIVSVRDKPMKMSKKVDGFSAAHALNMEYRGNFKGGVPSLMGLEGGTAPLSPRKFCEPAHAIWWVAETFPLL